MSNYGLKASLDGYDVKTTNDENLSFSTKFDLLKPYLIGWGSKIVSAATANTPPDPATPTESIVQILHGLGYKPFVLVFCTNYWRSKYFSPSTDVYSPYYDLSVGGPSPSRPSYAVDNNYLYIHLFNGDVNSDSTIKYKYHIFYNEVS